MPVLQAFSELPVVEHTLGGGDTPRGGGGVVTFKLRYIRSPRKYHKYRALLYYSTHV